MLKVNKSHKTFCATFIPDHPQLILYIFVANYFIEALLSFFPKRNKQRNLLSIVQFNMQLQILEFPVTISVASDHPQLISYIFVTNCFIGVLQSFFSYAQLPIIQFNMLLHMLLQILEFTVTVRISIAQLSNA